MRDIGENPKKDVLAPKLELKISLFYRSDFPDGDRNRMCLTTSVFSLSEKTCRSQNRKITRCF